MFYDILDKNRKKVLPLLKNFKDEFYLAGGTALALQIGHRDSIDFDFFTQNDIDTAKLFEKIKSVFQDFKILKIQEENNTLTVLIDENIKISFFTYKYKLINNFINEENLKLASVEDIALMKLSAILSRATIKDYIDLYFILKKYELNDLLKKSKEKFPDIDTNLILKSLVYFKDIENEPINFKGDNKISFEKVKEELERIIKNFII